MDTKKLRQKILDLAIRGKLVPQDPNDEPASVLLERIRAEKEQLIKEGKIKRSKKSAATDKSHYENVPFEIPENWEWTTIEDISESNIGLTYKPTDICADGVPVYRSNNIQNRRICLKELVRVNTDILEKQYLQEGDLLICARNGSRNLVGKCAIINKLIEPTSFGAFMAVCRSTLTPWIFQILNSEYFNTYLDDSNSTAINQVTQKMLLAFQLPVPPAAEQERIISKLKQWYEYIDEIENGKIELESHIKKTKSKILDLAISGKLVPQDPNDEPAIELLKRINPDFEPCDNSHYENLPFEVPDGWCWATLGSIGKWQSGATPSRMRKDYYGGDIPWLKTGDLNDWYITDIPEYITQQALNETSVKLNPAGSILIAMYGATIGKIGILTMPATTNQACCACISHNGIEQMYLFYYLLSHKEEFVRQGGGGAQPNISKEKIVETLIPIPPLSEQLRIIKAIEAIFNQIDNITAELS